MTVRVLIVDDEVDIQSSLAYALKDEGFEVYTASVPREAEKILQETPIDVGLFDVWFPEGDGIELLKYVRQKYPQSQVIMMSGHGNIELALNAIRLGAYDFLEKPLELEKVLVVLKNASESVVLKDENRRLTQEIANGTVVVGDSSAIQNMKSAIVKAAQVTSHVLIQGENGSGKELVARALHFWSPRSSKPFVAVNCAVIPESLLESELFGHEKGSFTGASQRHAGKFEQARDGTLFLDEISELSFTAQGKLLRVLEERSFERVGGHGPIRTDARIVAATNKDLQASIKAGKFREDLYFRLKVLNIVVPPLRERGDDVLALAKHFVEHLALEFGRAKPSLHADFLSWMKSYSWPGNVRELKNLLERILIMNPGVSEITPSLLPDDMDANPVAGSLPDLENIKNLTGSLRELRARFEKTILEQRLKSQEGSVVKAAESLGIERAHFYRKAKQYSIQLKDS